MRKGYAHTLLILAVITLIITAFGLAVFHTKNPEFNPPPSPATTVSPTISDTECSSDSNCSYLNYCTNRVPAQCYTYVCINGSCQEGNRPTPTDSFQQMTPTPKITTSIEKQPLSCPEGMIRVCQAGECECLTQ